MAEDDTAKTALVFDSSGAQKGAADFKAAADQVIAADAAVGQAADKAADAVTKAEGKKSTARRGSAKAAADASRAEIAAAAAAGDATVAATDRAVTSYSRQTRFLDSLAKQFDPLGAAANAAANKLQALFDITAKGGPNAQRAADMVGKAAERLVAAQEAMSGIGDRVAEVARLTNIFDPATASAQRMTAEMADLNKALKLGVVDAGEHARAWDVIATKYDEGAQAAKRAAAEERTMIEQARAAQAASGAQTSFNQTLGVRDPGRGGSARESASVFEAQFAAEDQALAEAKAHEAEALAGLKALEAEAVRLKAAFDPLTASAQRMTAELAELNKAQALGINIAGGYSAAYQKIVESYDEGTQAAKRAAEAAQRAAVEQRTMIEQARASQAASTTQTDVNQTLGVTDPGQAKSARQSASVFEAQFAAEDQALAEAKAHEAELARLTTAFDPATVAAQGMAAEIADLNKAQALGVNIAGGYSAALQAISTKYDENAQAAQRAAAAQRTMIEQARASQAASTAQTSFNQTLGVRDPGQGKSARESASVFEAEFAADEKLLAERKALERELNPLKTASLAYADALDRVRRAVDLGVISGKQAEVQTARITEEFAKANAPLGTLNAKLDEHTKVNGQAAFAQRQLSVQTVQFFSSLQGGQPFLLALVQQGHQVLDVALATGTGFSVLGQGIKTAFGYLVSPIGLMVAAGAGLLALGAAAEISARRLGTLRNQLSAVRNDAAGATQMAEDAARHLATTTSLGTNEARSASGTILSARQFQGSQAQLEALVVAAQKLSLKLGEDLPASAERMKKGLMDPAAFAQEMADHQLKGLDQALVNAVKNLQDMGKKAEAFDLVFAALQKSVADVKDNGLTPLQEALNELGKAFTRVGSDGHSLAESLGTTITGAAASAVSAITSVMEAIEKLKASAPAGTPGPGDSIIDSLKWYMPGYAAYRAVNAVTGPGTSQINDPVVAEAVRSSSAKAGLDPDFVARLQRSEGVQNPDGTWQTSPTGSLGPMQVRQKTYEGMAKQPQTFPGIESLDINKAGDNVQIGTMLLKHLIQRYDGDLKTAVLAYHDGETITNRALNGQNNPRTGLPQMFSQDALDQARKVMRGYSGTGLATGPAPLAPGEGAQTGRGQVTSGTTSASGAANIDLVDDAVKLANGMGLVSPAAEKAKGALDTLQLGLAKLKAENKEGTPEFALLTEAVRKARLAVQEAIEPADRLTQTLDRQTAGEVRIAAAYGKGYGEVARVTAAVKAEEEARALAAVGLGEYTELVAKLTAKYLAQADAQQKTILGKQVQEIDLQVQAQNKLADTYGKGEAAVVRITAQTKAEGEARALALAGLADYDTALAVLTNGYVATADAQARVGLAQQMLANDNQMVMIKGEGDALGATNEQRTLYLAKLHAELELKQRGLPINDAFAKGYIENATGIAKATLDLGNQKQALNDIAGAYSSAFDTIGNSITQSLLSGQGAAVNWRNVMTSMAQQVLQQFMKLSLLNPLLNSMFPGGEHRSTWNDVIGAMSKASSSEIPGSTTTTDSSGGTFGSVIGLVAKLAGAFGGGGGMASGSELAGLSAQAASNVAAGAGGLHGGGLVGTDPPSFTRMLDRSIIAQAPRLHAGLGANEFAAILERGERVLTGRQQQQVSAAANANGGGPTAINFHFPPNTQPDNFRRAGQQVAAHVQGALARARTRNG